MSGWFVKLMQKGQDRPRGEASAPARPADVWKSLDARDARHDAIIRKLREREAEDRAAREKRQRGYRQLLESDTVATADDPHSIRLHRFPASVPCRATPGARALLAEIGKQCPRATISFPHLPSGKQAVMLTRTAGSQPRQIGWLEHFVERDPSRCNLRDNGLVVDTDGSGMLRLQFRYPATPSRVSAGHASAASTRASRPSAADEIVPVQFSELRPALDQRGSARSAPPRLVWVTRPELATLEALQSREYEAFYVRFKLEVLAGIWSALSDQLSAAPASCWHLGTCFTVIREPDAANGKIHQRTIDDGGRTIDIGADRTYDAAPATDILLYYLDSDILADFVEIYFGIQGVGSADAWTLKEEFFTIIRRFWAGSESLASRHGGDLAAVIRMARRAVPTPAQAPLLKQDWMTLRQSLIDRYGEGGRKAGDLSGEHIHRPRTAPASWPFASFPAGEVNVGLRVVYRQEWRTLGPHRGEVVRTVTSPAIRAGDETTTETFIEPGDSVQSLADLARETAKAIADRMKWPLDFDGSINTGIRTLAAGTAPAVDAEHRARSRDTDSRLTDVMQATARRLHAERPAIAPEEHEENGEVTAVDVVPFAPQDDSTRVFSRMQNEYEILTRPFEIQNVVLVAEKLPSPADISLKWVRRHAWIIARALLDESFRGALDTIGSDDPADATDMPRVRQRLYEHISANVLHYQRAIWQQEDPQQRSMRYRKWGRKVPLDWRFELASGELTIDQLADRLTAKHVDGQFAAYSGGREVDLDQAIDPAGPIGYYGNYAIHPMRADLCADELFSMLHFFKSPYLRGNPETREHEVDDSAHPGHARRFALDTDGIIVDVIRRADSSPEAGDGSERRKELARAPRESQLMLQSVEAIVMLGAGASRGATTECGILQGGPTLLAGAGGISATLGDSSMLSAGAVSVGRIRAPAHDAGAGILTRNDEGQSRLLVAGSSHDATSSEPLLLHEGARPLLTAIAGVPAGEPNVRAIVSRGTEVRLLLRAGPLRGAGIKLLIQSSDDRQPKLLSSSSPMDSNREDHVIIPGGDEWLRPSLVAG